MTALDSYLELNEYCDFFGGLRWSPEEQTIVQKDGTTFAFAPEIATFIEGFASGRRLIHFCHVLHFLHLLRTPWASDQFELSRLQKRYAKVTGPKIANAGALAAVLCRGVPELAVSVDYQQILDRLRNPLLPVYWIVTPGAGVGPNIEAPVIGPRSFERQINDALQAFSDDDIEIWFKTGRGPVKDAAQRMAGELPKKRDLDGLLVNLLDRPRLTGARPFVAQLVSALTLPPRRMTPQELPMGGYADVTTRGHVDQLLPSQFALDEWDFFRRFAEHELLFFRREEPHKQTNRDLVVLLDQGVRTWGDVRLVLSAAVLALGKQACSGGIPFLLATTGSNGTLFDPVKLAEEPLGELIEASDLTPHPGLALESVLEQPAPEARDVVLLTHPRALLEGDVQAAARRLTKTTRLFAMALDDSGEVQLSELRRGGIVPVRQFRVDLSLTDAPVPVGGSARETASGWSGDVEPIPFPFRFGLTASTGKDLFDFDYAGRWFFVASRDGMLHAYRVDGSASEILPRGILMDGKPLPPPMEVIGVRGGFVAVGKANNGYYIAHYDMERRRGSFPVLVTDRQIVGWCYAPGQHCVVAYDQTRNEGFSVDLTTGEIFLSYRPFGASRAAAAWNEWVNGTLPTRWNFGLRLPKGPGWQHCFYHLPESGALAVAGENSQWPTIAPLRDGKLLLQDRRILEGQLRNQTLSVFNQHYKQADDLALHTFGWPDGNVLAEFTMRSANHGFTLSADGALIARQIGEGQILVNKCDEPKKRLLQIGQGGFPDRTQFLLRSNALVLRTGSQRIYRFTWQGGLFLQAETMTLNLQSPEAAMIQHEMLQGQVYGAKKGSSKMPAPLGYDPHRFTDWQCSGPLLAALDRYGQVSLFDGQDRLLCILFGVGGQMAGWMPDGTRFGPERLTGGRPTPDAHKRFAEVLWRASQEGTART